MEKWVVSINNFEIQYEPRKAQKSKVLEGFLADFPIKDNTWETDLDINAQLEVTYAKGGQHWQEVSGWKVFTDGLVSKKSAAIGIVLI
ncbi:hypothetical protein FRX31_030460 [Thalictrum thalictroides]|uniref:Uncharacterized protein n=1 Tax=Thalictrum thalictroides TaxID=46969 RepID=A0A7J6V4W8_THATH|nr:hypothetical protein FRX31_030460 [Thalictrum thalictroides]